jgi:hypothetical protein
MNRATPQEQLQFSETLARWLNEKLEASPTTDTAMVAAALMQASATIALANGLDREQFLRGVGMAYDSIAGSLNEWLTQAPWTGCA